MYTAVQASKRQKHIPLNTYVSLYGSAGTNRDGEEEESLVNVLSDVAGIRYSVMRSSPSRSRTISSSSL